MKVYWADRAKHRLTAIHDDISEKPSSSAGKTVRKIIARSRQIAEHPPAGRKTPNINEMTAEKYYPTLYRAIYRIRSHQADVLSMMHDRQLLPSDIKKR